MTNEELDRMLEELCESKAEEFRMIGYEHITAKEVWDCVSEKYKKGEQPELHRIVNDILSLKITKMMNHLTMSALKGNPF